MRESKFRAWNKEKRIMVYSDEDGSDGYNYEGCDWSPIHMVNKLLEDDDYIWLQYTGLKDKHSKEIYEGDIFQWTLGHIEDIKWDEDLNGWNIDRVGLETGKVIGNIYENPELLK